MHQEEVTDDALRHTPTVFVQQRHFVLRLRPSLGGSFFQSEDAVFVILLAIQFTPHIDFPQRPLRPRFASPAVVLAGLFQILRHAFPVVVIPADPVM